MTVNFVSSYFKKDQKFGFGKQGGDLAKAQVLENILAYFDRDVQGASTINYKYEEEFACDQISLVNTEETKEKTRIKTANEHTQTITTGSTFISKSVATASIGDSVVPYGYASGAYAGAYASQGTTYNTYRRIYNYTRVTTQSEYERYQVRRDVLCVKKSNVIRVRAEVRFFSDRIKEFHPDILSDFIENHTRWTLDSYLATVSSTANQLRLILRNPYLTQNSLEVNFGSKNIETLILNMNNQLKYLTGFGKFKNFIGGILSEEVILRIQKIDRAMTDFTHLLLNLEKGALYAMSAVSSNDFDLIEVISHNTINELSAAGYRVKFNLPNKIKNYSMCIDRTLQKAALNEEIKRETSLTAKQVFKKARESWDSQQYQDLVMTIIKNEDFYQLPVGIMSEFQKAAEFSDKLPKTKDITDACIVKFDKQKKSKEMLSVYSKFKDCVDKYLSASKKCLVLPNAQAFHYTEEIYLDAHIICTSETE
ncbi:MAG: hypothetical protein JNL11_18440 [Bdellovibrionaceae bacterium]|nr:hypothetical protein [Pseudobdellovibrionaceae bacterium]